MKSQRKKLNDIVRRCKAMTRMMSSTSNVDVVIRGNVAQTDFSTVYLPSGDFDCSDYVELLEGAIVHEVGHIEETDPNIWTPEFLASPLLKNLTNIIEDVRMENRVVVKWPGYERRLLKMVDQAINRGWFLELPPNMEIPKLFTAFVLYYARGHYMRQHVLKGFADNREEILESMIGEQVITEIKSVLEKIPTLKTTSDSLEMAKALLKILEDNLPDEDDSDSDDSDSDDSDSDDSDSDDSDSDDSDSDDSDSDDSDSDDSDSDDSDSDDSDSDDSDSDDSDSDDSDSDDSDSDDSDSDDSDSDDSDSDDSDSDDSDSDSDDSDSDNSDSDDSDSDDSDSDDSDSDNSDSDASSSSQDEDGMAELIEQLLNADEDELMEDFHDLVRKGLEDDAESAESEGRKTFGDCEVFGVVRSPLVKGSCVDASSCQRQISNVKQTLKRTLIDKNKDRTSYSKRGTSIDSSRLAGVATGQTRIFRHEQTVRAENTAISIVVDNSSSMNWREFSFKPNLMSIANHCAYTIAKAIDGVKGVRSEVMFYPHNNNVYLAKSFKERAMPDRFSVGGCDYTNTGEAMECALRSLLVQPESKKMLIVLTDGAANTESIPLIRDSIEVCEAANIQVVAFGIGGVKAVDGFDDFVPLADLENLHLAFKEAINQKLLS